MRFPKADAQSRPRDRARRIGDPGVRLLARHLAGSVYLSVMDASDRERQRPIVEGDLGDCESTSADPESLGRQAYVVGQAS